MSHLHAFPYSLYFHRIIKPFNDQCPSHIEASQLICSANQLTRFFMSGTFVVKEFNNFFDESLSSFLHAFENQINTSVLQWCTIVSRRLLLFLVPSETYLKRFQTFKIERFARLLTIFAKQSMLVVWRGSEYGYDHV